MDSSRRRPKTLRRAWLKPRVAPRSREQVAPMHDTHGTSRTHRRLVTQPWAHGWLPNPGGSDSVPLLLEISIMWCTPRPRGGEGHHEEPVDEHVTLGKAWDDNNVPCRNGQNPPPLQSAFREGRRGLYTRSLLQRRYAENGKGRNRGADKVVAAVGA